VVSQLCGAAIMLASSATSMIGGVGLDGVEFGDDAFQW
jgi:hypothetical protein